MSGLNNNPSRSISTGQISPSPTPASSPKAPTTQVPGTAPSPVGAAPLAADEMQVQSKLHTNLSLEPAAPRTPGQQQQEAIKAEILSELEKLPGVKDVNELKAIQDRVDELKRGLSDAEWESLNPSEPKPAFDPAELTLDDTAIHAMIKAQSDKAAGASTPAELQAIQERVDHLQRLLNLTPQDQ